MVKFVDKMVSAYKVEIFIGGDFTFAKEYCEAYCTQYGLCVTVEPTTYCFTGGSCEGVRVGLINYGRFPKSQHVIWATAVDLACYLRSRLLQGSYTVQDDKQSYFYSERPEDGCEP